MPSPMLSTVKEQLIKVVDHIPGLRSRRSPMAETPPFKATDNFGHRYQDDKVLRKALIEICGFKDAEIRIQVNHFAAFSEQGMYLIIVLIVTQVTEQNGLDAQLPRLVTKVR
ncbi:hypothetical protein RRF57_002543 [Xylaria bambusicola]|uniref:Uncharacterized protein n=1 Tax=Xylaria bambusicola TaxID=326684 RepID=A0AAN7Z4K9_9PEZI